MTAAAAGVRHLGCPSCGATLSHRADRRTVLCRACGNRSVLVGIDPALRFKVVPNVSRERAIATVRRCLATWPVRAGTAESAGIVAAELFYVPFYEFEALQAGTVRRSKGVQFVKTGRVDWSTGVRRFVDAAGREVSEDAHYRRHREEVVDTAVVLRTHHAAGVAGGAADWGLGAIDVAALREAQDVRIVPFGSSDAPPGHALPPRRGRAEAEEEVRRLAGVVGDAEVEFLASDLRYLFVPVWVVRYRVDRHPYAFVLDAVHGRVLSGRAPETPQRGALFVVLAASFVGFPVGKIAAGVFSVGAGDLGRAIGLVIQFVGQLGAFSLLIPVVLLVPLAFAWGEFRFRGEVSFGPAGPVVVKLARPATTWLERLLDRLLEMIERQADEAAQR